MCPPSPSHSSPRPIPAALPRVVLDTNILLLPFERSFPLESELARWTTVHRISVPSAVVGELGRLEARGRSEAGLAISLARRFDRIRSRKLGDDGILELAHRLGAWVVTSDRDLRLRLNRAGIPVLHPRGSRLELIPGLPRAPRRKLRPSSRAIPRS